MPALTEAQAQLLLDPNFAVVAVVRPDGTPQTSVVWIDWDGEDAIFTTKPERAKTRLLEANPHVNLIVVDMQDPYRYVEIEGTATLDFDEARAAAHIHEMSHKYRGVPYPHPEGRNLVRVRPERVHPYGVE